MVKQPEPDPDDPEVPRLRPDPQPGEAKTNATGRWDYVRGQMVELGYLTQAEADALVYPTTVVTKDDPTATRPGRTDAPAGLVVNHVLDELTPHRRVRVQGHDWQSIADGGYKIVTTLDSGPRRRPRRRPTRRVDGQRACTGQPANLQAALVAVEPGTGRVLAYYGGHDGKGNDYAGFYYDEEDDVAGFGAHPPGSSFKVYTWPPRCKAGISLNSYWHWSRTTCPAVTGSNQIRNASSCTLDVRPSHQTP